MVIKGVVRLPWFELVLLDAIDAPSVIKLQISYVESEKSLERLLSISHAEENGRCTILRYNIQDSNLLEYKILSAIPVFHDQNMTLQAIPLGPEYELSCLFPRDRTNAIKMIYHKSTRINDEETLRFVCRQTASSSLTEAVTRLEAIKVMVYRNLESGSRERIDSCIDLLRDAQTYATMIETTFDKRFLKNSRLHAEVSVKCLYIVVYLMLELFDEAIVTGKELVSFAKEVESCPIAANNLSQGLLILGFIAWCKSDDSFAFDAWNATLQTFRSAAVSYPALKPAIFDEIALSFRAAQKAVRFLRSIEQRKSVADFSPLDAISDGFRLRTGSPGEKLLHDVFTRLYMQMNQSKPESIGR